MKQLTTIFATIFIILSFTGCTDNTRARNFGGNLTIDLPCNTKLFDVTWKNNDIWYATRSMKENEEPETYYFREDSQFGMMEGTVEFVECKED